MPPFVTFCGYIILAVFTIVMVVGAVWFIAIVSFVLKSIRDFWKND